MVAFLFALWTTVFASSSHSVPRLEMQSASGKGTCSAVVFSVENGTAAALTAAHCVAHDPKEPFDLTANERHAEVVLANNLLDLAIIEYRAKKDVALPIAPDAPETGAEVAVIGYAFGVDQLVMQSGHVAQSYNKETKSTWIDAMTIFGDSGGAVVDDQGRLVAVTSRILSGGLAGQSAHIAAAVPVDAIHDFIAAYRKHVANRK